MNETLTVQSPAVGRKLVVLQDGNALLHYCGGSAGWSNAARQLSDEVKLSDRNRMVATISLPLAVLQTMMDVQPLWSLIDGVRSVTLLGRPEGEVIEFTHAVHGADIVIGSKEFVLAHDTFGAPIGWSPNTQQHALNALLSLYSDLAVDPTIEFDCIQALGSEVFDEVLCRPVRLC